MKIAIKIGISYTQVADSSPAGRGSQVLHNTTFTKTDKAGSKSADQDLVQILFSDPELERLIERWPGLSAEDRKIILLISKR